MKLLSIFLYSIVIFPHFAQAMPTSGSDPEVPDILNTQLSTVMSSHESPPKFKDRLTAYTDQDPDMQDLKTPPRKARKVRFMEEASTNNNSILDVKTTDNHNVLHRLKKPLPSSSQQPRGGNSHSHFPVPLFKQQPGSQPEPSAYSPYKTYAPYAVGFCAALGAYVTFAKSAGKAAEAAAQQRHHWSRAYLTPKNYGRAIRFLYSGLTGTGTALATWFILRYV
jgi:hypothetical protein